MVRIEETRPLSKLKRWKLKEIVSQERRLVAGSRWQTDSGTRRSAPKEARREREAMAVMMRSMLEVADNSGARKLQIILPLGGGDRTNGPSGRRDSPLP